MIRQRWPLSQEKSSAANRTVRLPPARDAAAPPAPGPRENASASRRPLILLGVAVLALAAWAIYYFVFARDHVSTDDAYVNGNLVRLTPQVTGTVIAINTDETQFVQRGAVLVQLDPRDAQVALAQAKANLAQTVRDVAQLFAEQQRDTALVRSQQVQLDQASQDVARDQPLIAVHGVSQETVQHEAERGAHGARGAGTGRGDARQHACRHQRHDAGDATRACCRRKRRCARRGSPRRAPGS